MSYQRKDIQILGGGLNLLPPVDKVPRTDYLQAQNWRVDRLGKLVSRLGYSQKFSVAGAGIAHSAAVYGGVNGAYYLGCNDAITTPSGSVYYNFAALAIATGFDGNRIGFAAMNGFMWMMNRAKQGRHSGASGFETWNIAAPVVSAAAAAAATPGVTANLTYTYNVIPNAAYVHYLTIAGVTYSFVENGYSGAQIPVVIAALAMNDTNCSVTHAAGSQDVVITPIIPNTLFAVSGSDGNSAGSVATGAISSLPNGTYQFYVTFENADGSLESNPGPASASVTVVSSAITLTAVPVSADARVTRRNIYATGGTLQAAYLVGSIPDNTTTTITISLPDLEATNNGVEMPTDHDAQPAASGIVGPHYNRLFAFSTALHPNRLFWTDDGLPQYWPGANDEAVGNWVDVGADGEAIVWCTIHRNLTVIYKERSIWVLIGDPDNGILDCVSDVIGLAGQFALTKAGLIDYFVAANNLYTFDMDRVEEGKGNAILPLFNSSLTSDGTAPGSILPGTAYNSTSTSPYAVALGYALGKLYIGYAEQASGAQYNLLVYHELSGRWFSHRSTLGNVTGFHGFVFDGVQMVGLTGAIAGAAKGFNLDEFRGAYTQDAGPLAIRCIYQSHYEDCGLPDNQKVWLELVVDYEFAGADTALLGVAGDGGTIGLNVIATLSGTGRRQASFPLASGAGVPSVKIAGAPMDDLTAKNLSVQIVSDASSLLIIHNIFLYYYEEARLATSASTLPTDLGSPKVKQCKELQLDIDATNGTVKAEILTDLPGNALAIRQTATVAQGGRAVWRYPFPSTEGFLWRVAVTAVGNVTYPAGAPMRVYSVRLLMRVVGVYVEAYEATAGFVWDSMEQTFATGVVHISQEQQVGLASLPIKRFREISLEMETFGVDVTVKFLTDLPGNAEAVRATLTVNTAAAGRRFVRLPLPANIEGRMCRLQFSGVAKFILYQINVEMIAIGVYLEAYEAAGGAVYDSREVDFGTPLVKEAREMELDIETTGVVTVKLFSDLSATYTGAANTTGRQLVMLPLTVNAALDQFIEGRLLQLVISGANAFRLYGARIRVRAFGQYLTAAESGAGAFWDTTELDLGSQSVKQLREVELDLWAYGPYTVTIYTDLPGNVMTSRVVSTQAATSGRTPVLIPLPQGAIPENYIFGRRVRVTVTSAAAFKLFGARIGARAIGVYVETYEAAGGAVWDSMTQDLDNPSDKTFDQLHFEMDSDGPCNVAVYTDLPGEVFTIKGFFPVTTAATSQHWATVPLPPGIEGRSIRLVVSSSFGFRIYKAQVRAAQVGRYLCAQTPAGNDSLTTLEFDFESERLKLYKKIEIDMRADGVVTLAVLTNQTGALAVFASPNLATPNGRETLTQVLPPGARGRLLRLSMTSAAAARIYRLRVWTRPVNEPGAAWKWERYPLEDSDVLPKWFDLPVAPTAPAFTWTELPVDATEPAWKWAPLPVNATEPQWFWAKVLSVDETPDEWKFIDVPFEVIGE